MWQWWCSAKIWSLIGVMLKSMLLLPVLMILIHIWRCNLVDLALLRRVRLLVFYLIYVPRIANLFFLLGNSLLLASLSLIAAVLALLVLPLIDLSVYIVRCQGVVKFRLLPLLLPGYYPWASPSLIHLWLKLEHFIALMIVRFLIVAHYRWWKFAWSSDRMHLYLHRDIWRGVVLALKIAQVILWGSLRALWLLLSGPLWVQNGCELKRFAQRRLGSGCFAWQKFLIHGF